MAKNPAFEKKHLIEHKESPAIKQKARGLVNTAIASKKIAKDNFCWWCLTTNKKVFAHHEDYSKPLDIVWLCGKCHFYAKYNWGGPKWTIFPWHNRSKRPNFQASEVNENQNQAPYKVTALLTTEQKEGLDRVAKKIMKYRSRDLKGHESKERITANTLIRALIDIFLEKEAESDMKILADEEAVKEWVKSL